MRTIHSDHPAFGWDRDRPPLATIAPGDELEIELRDASDGQIAATSVAADIATIDFSRANPLTGPVAIDGAAPGDTIEVEILDLAGAPWGWSALIPGFGLLADDFPDPHVRVSRVGDGRVDVDGLATLPHRPFIGTIGVTPGEAGVLDVLPPRRVGGNLDLTDVRPGARLLLPVEAPGAMLSLGDGHAVQGDGEVCGTAVETPAVARIRVGLRKGEAPAAPVVRAPGVVAAVPGERIVTTGVGPDLMTGARDAVRSMIDALTREASLDPRDAYLLCSLAADLRIGEIVDAPNWVVACSFPLGALA